MPPWPSALPSWAHGSQSQLPHDVSLFLKEHPHTGVTVGVLKSGLGGSWRQPSDPDIDDSCVIAALHRPQSSRCLPLGPGHAQPTRRKRQYVGLNADD